MLKLKELKPEAKSRGRYRYIETSDTLQEEPEKRSEDDDEDDDDQSS